MNELRRLSGSEIYIENWAIKWRWQGGEREREREREWVKKYYKHDIVRDYLGGTGCCCLCFIGITIKL